MINKAKMLKLLKYLEVTRVEVFYKPEKFFDAVNVTYDLMKDSIEYISYDADGNKISIPFLSLRLQEEFFEKAVDQLWHQAVQERAEWIREQSTTLARADLREILGFSNVATY